MLEQTGARRAPRRPGRHALGRQPAAGQHRDRAALRRPRCCCSTSPRPALDPRQRERLWEFVARARRRRHDGDLLDPPPARGASATATGCWSSPTASGSSTAPRASCTPAAPGSGAHDFEAAFVALPRTSGGTDVRWLLLKDLQILRRSPLIVALLVAYPVVLARADRVRAPAAPTEAAGRVPERGRSPASSSSSAAATASIDRGLARDELCSRVECVDVSSREEAEPRRSRAATCSRR